MGQVVKAQVTSVTDDGVLCTVIDGVRGLVTTDHMPGIYRHLFSRLIIDVMDEDMDSRFISAAGDHPQLFIDSGVS